MKKKGFTLIELLVVIAIIALLLTILMPSLGRARALAKRAACASNLSAVSKALATYIGEDSRYASYPWLLDNKSGIGRAVVGNMNSWVEEADIGTLADDTHSNVAQNLALLCFKKLVAYKGFTCPADSEMQPSADRGDKHGFLTPTGLELSYGYHSGWSFAPTSNSTTKVVNKAPLNENMTGEFVIMGDFPKGCSYNGVPDSMSETAGGSWTHGYNEGVTVLTQNGAVAWKAHNADLTQDLMWDKGGGGLYTAGGTNDTKADTNLDVTATSSSDSILVAAPNTAASN